MTGEQDRELLNRAYSYWPQGWVEGQTCHLFTGHADGQARFFDVDLSTDAVARLGSPVGYRGTAEGWYWDETGALYLCDGPRLRRVGPFTGTDAVVFSLDDDPRFPGCELWQAHSSDNGSAHSATVRRVVADGAYPKLGTVVFRRGELHWFPSVGELDESIIDRTGDVVIIQEDHNNRIIRLSTNEVTLIPDSRRAIAHCDVGADFAIGEADKPDPGACVYWDLRHLGDQPRILFPTTNMGHVSVRGQTCLLSDRALLSLVAFDGSGVTPVIEHGMRVEDPERPYDYQCRAALTPCGRAASFISNREGRFDLFLLVL